MNDSPLQRSGRGLSTIRDPQFTQDAVDMSFHGCFGDGQLAADLLVASPGDDEPEDIEFTVG